MRARASPRRIIINDCSLKLHFAPVVLFKPLAFLKTSFRTVINALSCYVPYKCHHDHPTKIGIIVVQISIPNNCHIQNEDFSVPIQQKLAMRANFSRQSF